MRRKEVEAADWPAASPAPPSLAGACPRCPSFAPFPVMRRLLQTKGPPEAPPPSWLPSAAAAASLFPLSPPCERVPQVSPVAQRGPPCPHLSRGFGGHARSSLFHQQDDGFHHQPWACGEIAAQRAQKAALALFPKHQWLCVKNNNKNTSLSPFPEMFKSTR